MIEFMKNPYDGDEWEKVIDDCYRLRFQREGYTKIPANQGGDGGIEGFVGDGKIVYQCYCPEKKYTDNELDKKLKIKINNDLKKLINNGEELKASGIKKIEEWHFVTPEYRDKRLVEYCEKKRVEVMEAKETKSLEYISPNFRIQIKVIEDFREEINKLVNLGKCEFDIALKKPIAIDPDWSKCNSDKINNIKRKIGAIINKENNSRAEMQYDLLIKYIGNSYINGIELLNSVQNNNSILYEKIISLNETYKNKIIYKCIMNDDSSINKKMFDEILEEFENYLKECLGGCLSIESIGELKWDLVSSWIADCPMEFY